MIKNKDRNERCRSHQFPLPLAEDERGREIEQCKDPEKGR